MKLKEFTEAGLCILAIIIVFSLCATIAMADPAGAVNPTITQANIGRTICTKGYSKSVRPPSYYTSKIKRTMIGRDGDMSFYELDHYIPISLGGATKDRANLWPQPWLGRCNARDKDRLERALHQSVCAKAVTLKDAQHSVLFWRATYKEYFGKEC